MKNLLLTLFSFTTIALQAQINIIPKPVSATIQKGNFILSKKTVILLTDEGEQNTANFLSDYLKIYYGLELKIAKQATNNYIRLTTKKIHQARAGRKVPA